MNPITYKKVTRLLQESITLTRLAKKKCHTTSNFLLSYCVEQANAKDVNRHCSLGMGVKVYFFYFIDKIE